MMKSPQHEIVRPFPMHHSAAERVYIARKLNRLIRLPHARHHLLARNLSAFVSNYGDKDKFAAEKAFKSGVEQHEAKKVGSFVLYAADGSLQGLATIDPSLVVSKQAVPLPRLLFGSMRAKKRLEFGPRISAFVIPSEGKNGQRALTAAYKELGNPDGIAADFYPDRVASTTNAYTVEPLDSLPWVKRAIINGGFLRQEAGYYGDPHSRLTFPVRSDLYAAQPLT